MKIEFEPSGGDLEMLAEILGTSPDEVEAALAPYLHAAATEYVEMFLGRKVFTRGQDIREYRLFLLMKEVFERLPDEQEVSDLFQTTESQSRSLIRSVMSKYQYDLTDVLRWTHVSRGVLSKSIRAGSPPLGSGGRRSAFDDNWSL